MSQRITAGQGILIKPYKSENQEAVKSLILAGLAEHWGKVDPALNPDLNNISASYANATFLVYCAWPETALLAKCEDRACQGTAAEKKRNFNRR